jgi:uncharacterized membrane protein
MIYAMNRLYFYIKCLSLIGIILGVYLLIEQMIQSSFRPCNINNTINCDAIISGGVAKTLGIPTPLYGLIGYIIIFLSAVYKKQTLLLSTASFGLMFCLWIGYQELFLLRVICPVCILCELIMVCINIMALVKYRQK